MPRLLAQDGRVGLDDVMRYLLFGVSLAVLALAARSVWPAIRWHVGTNLVGIFLSVGLGVRWSGPTWLVGAGGEEGGVLLVLEAVLRAAAALALAALIVRRRRTAALAAQRSGSSAGTTDDHGLATTDRLWP